MEKRWQRLDLHGGGVQGLNLRLAREMKKRRTAYLLLLAFPLGLHRAYLDSRKGALAYCLASAAALALAFGGWSAAAWAVAGGSFLGALLDVRWIDRRVASRNKEIRLNAYLGQGAAPPRGYAGRSFDQELQDYFDEKAAESGGQEKGTPRPGDRRHPSLAEQERMLRELARRKRDLP